LRTEEKNWLPSEATPYFAFLGFASKSSRRRHARLILFCEANT
jgi:hypothetical protein